MLLRMKLREYIAACFPGIWLESHEHEDALAEIVQLCRDESWQLAVWDVDQGLQIPGEGDSEAVTTDPLDAVRSVRSLATPQTSAVLVLRNFHRFVNSTEIVQALANQFVRGKQDRTFLIVLSPTTQIPPELEKQFVVLEHQLPGRTQLEEIARGIAVEDGELPEGEDLDTVLDAAAGLTRHEAEAAFSLSLVRDQAICPEAVWEMKSQLLKKSGLVSLHRGQETFADLGGLDAMKSFCTRLMQRQGSGSPIKRPRGVLLLSPPGCGKSAFAKALGNETGRPTLILDIGSLFGSLVGQSESNIRQALRIADAMAPCVLMIDELEKGLSGVFSSAQTDSGVSARLFGTFLTWLNDHESDVFVLGTVNDISKVPPEFARAERFDGVFFVDLPGATQKSAIWDIWLRAFELDQSQPKPKTSEWTGAEICACCRLAALLDLPLVDAAKNIVPVAVTAGESVERLRNWASGRCLDADGAGTYRRAGTAKKSRRRVVRDPALN